jgi:hypothetical protein
VKCCRTIPVFWADTGTKRPEQGQRGLSSLRVLAFGVAASLALFGAGCGASPNTAAVLAPPLVVTPVPAAPPAPPEEPRQQGTPALDAVLLEHVPEGTSGPYLGSSRGGPNIALWAAPTEGSGRRWFSRSLDAKDAPLGPAVSLADAPNQLGLVNVSATAQGFLALASSVTETGTRIEALALGKAGELVSGPTPVVHDRGDVVWVDTVQVGGTSVALWATLAVGSADISLTALNPLGAPVATPTRVLEGAKAWQAVEFSDGIALAAVLAGPNPARQSVRVSFLDTNGHVLGQTEVRTGANLNGQVDATRVGDNLLVCWTERDALDERLYLAVLGPDTHLVGKPRAAVSRFGSQRLLELIPAADRHGDAILAWESVDQAPRGQQRFQLARVSEQGSLKPGGAELSFAGEGAERPEFARKGEGVATLTRAMPCARDAKPCTDLKAVPTFVEFGPALEVLASEPLRLLPEAGRTADLAWGLRCDVDTCAALGALPASPVPIFGVELRARSDQWPAVATRVTDAVPRSTEMRTLRESDVLRDLASARLGGSWLIATLTQFDESTPYVRRKTPAPDGKLAPVRALLSVQPFKADGAEAGSAHVISYRARSTSGLALTRASGDQALLTWTALDKQHSEVFGTLLSRAGEAVAQRMLSVGAGDVSQVAAVAVPRGFLVAWIGDHGGEARAFATKVGTDLTRGSPQQALSQGPGAVTSLSLLGRAEGAWLAQVRATENQQTLAVTRLDGRTGARLGDDVRIQQSDVSALASPWLVARGDGALLAWIERPEVANGEAPRAWLLELDRDARRKGEPLAVPSLLGNPSAVQVSCEEDGCQGVLDSRAPSGHALEGFSWDGGLEAALSTRVLVRRDTAKSDPPALALANTGVFYADRREQAGLLRRVGVGWR